MRYLSDTLKKITTDLKEAQKAVAIFYLVGTAGLLIPFTFPFFILLVPFALLFSFVLLAFFHHGKPDRRSLLVFSGIFLVSFLAEMAGVATGTLFGSYAYGSTLGLKLFSTPLIIGLNWLFLVYATASITEKWRISLPLKVIAGALLMVAYDLVMEQCAPPLEMWQWENDTIPARNYLVWFGLALIFHAVLKFFRVKTENGLAPALFSTQFLFFLILTLFLQ